MGGELPSFLAHGSAKDNVCVTVSPWEAHRAHGLHVFVQEQLCSSVATFKKKQFLGICFYSFCFWSHLNTLHDPAESAHLSFSRPCWFEAVFLAAADRCAPGNNERSGSCSCSRSTTVGNLTPNRCLQEYTESCSSLGGDRKATNLCQGSGCCHAVVAVGHKMGLRL